MTPAFEVARTIGNNLGGAFKSVRESNTIEQILSDASKSGDPAQLQNAIGKILSQVSPERQPAAIKLLESTYERVKEKEKLGRERAQAAKYGIPTDLPPALQAEIYKQTEKGKRLANVYGQQQAPVPFGGQPQPQEALGGQPQAAAPIGAQGAQQGPGMAQAVQPAQGIRGFTDEQLVMLSGQPDKEISEPAKQELKRRQTSEKEKREDIRHGESETLKMRQEIAQKALDAEQGIAEKERMMELIDTGNVNDPSLATILDKIPMKLGARFLTPETTEYKSILINGYRDLRTIFKGQTRVKEIEVLENKLADIYLTDQQKKAILKSSIKTLQYDLIRAEIAVEVEEKFPGLKALAFNKKVIEMMNPKLDSLANRIIDEQKSIINDAENKKKIPLNPKDPEDAEIMRQIKKEAKGNNFEAKKIAKQKGYSW